MTDRITIAQLNIYNAYGGDTDWMYRNNKAGDQEIFGDDLLSTWFFIAHKLQDVRLIARQHVSREYVKAALIELREKTEPEVFDFFTAQIPFYADFQKVQAILVEIRSYITAGTGNHWARYDDGAVFLADLNEDIENIGFCDFVALEKVNLAFAVTGTYQEIALSNGWSAAYLMQAEAFDRLYETLKRV